MEHGRLFPAIVEDQGSLAFDLLGKVVKDTVPIPDPTAYMDNAIRSDNAQSLPVE